MRFLWKSQLKREHGKFLPDTGLEKKKVTRKERFHPRRSRFLFAGVIFLWLFFFGTVLYLAIFSPYLMFVTWQVDGLELVNEEDFRHTVDQELSKQYFGFMPRNTFSLVQPAALEQVLRLRYPLLRDVSVRRIFPNRLSFTVQERSILVVWCSSGTCSQILEDGNVAPTTIAFEEEENQARTLILRDESDQPLTLRKDAFESTLVPSIIALRNGLQTRFGIEIEKEIKVASRFASELRVKTSTGWEIYFSTRMASEKSLNTLGLLLGTEISKEQEKDLQYIDLRTENRVFYRYKNSQEEEKSLNEVLGEKEKTKKE